MSDTEEDVLGLKICLDSSHHLKSKSLKVNSCLGLTTAKSFSVDQLKPENH